jgi:hypothetical protein
MAGVKANKGAAGTRKEPRWSTPPCERCGKEIAKLRDAWRVQAFVYTAKGFSKRLQWEHRDCFGKA